MDKNQPLTEAVFYILLAARKPVHGYGIIQEVDEMTGGRVHLGPGTLYGAINSLLDKGWIVLYSAQPGSRKKKEYVITPAGRAVFAAEMDRLRELAEREKTVAIGEIGLDYYWKDNPPREFQQTVFRRQIELALELDLPVIVHDREAHRDCLEAVKAHPQVTGVYHCYSGSLEDAKTLVKLGWTLSFTGVVTYKNARKSLEVIQWLPMERIMIETDSPYLTPEPFRGKRNDSGYVYRVAETIAQVKGMDPEEVAERTLENGKRFFRIAP